MCSIPPSSHVLVCQCLSCTGESKTGYHIARCACIDAKPREKKPLHSTATLMLEKAQLFLNYSSPCLLHGHAADSCSTFCPLECPSPFLQSHFLPRVLSHGIAPSQMHNFTSADLHDVSARSFLRRRPEYQL